MNRKVAALPQAAVRPQFSAELPQDDAECVRKVAA